ncbi:flagellar hook-basal body protein [bacterium]|nr:flagellar hook-basal body protein [bacterium]
MIKGIYHSAAGMVPRYNRLTNVSNNLANANTTAFKADRRYFTALIDNELVQPAEKGRPARTEDLDTGLQTQFRQGALKKTENATDFAINGDGFFMVENPETGEQFLSRNGWFRLTKDLELITHTGYAVIDDSGAPISVGDEKFQVTENGEIYSNGELRGAFGIYDLKDKSALVKRGDGMYTIPEDVEETLVDKPIIHQGFLEESNVNIVEEMVVMISLNRNYESSQKALHAQDETLKMAVNQLGRFS